MNETIGLMVQTGILLNSGCELLLSLLCRRTSLNWNCLEQMGSMVTGVLDLGGEEGEGACQTEFGGCWGFLSGQLR